jgi:hypothetical protein
MEEAKKRIIIKIYKIQKTLDSKKTIWYTVDMNMKEEFVLQGRRVIDEEIELIKNLMIENPTWCRSRLSQELCKRWNWRTLSGQMKDMACRSYLRKLELHGRIKLPPAKTKSGGNSFPKMIMPVLHEKSPITGALKELLPIELRVVEVEDGYDLNRFKYFISAYHYLGWSGTVGENLKYLIFDKVGRLLACMMFGAAAWKVAPRDEAIGWDAQTRKRNLSLITNNNRFLILPWVSVKDLASHILGSVCRRIADDFMNKYHHPVYLLETFVEKERFKGTCYKAANWKNVGDTRGRGKLDIKKECALPVKSIWLYPLTQSYREKLKG